ncbi:tRNA pseudouridine synthase B [Spiroplasma sabaudiense Ar-1343]|uniref:tRNA pseudouridine synthase B n=1 Tax=Spiroplasma sabaudiense Ar-1343 TaxID=1276257 RepID=W6AJR3_9MOLU|nr:tRNA pseudouridine(55) synthase TruB [Spiroplasma sabaudiense]AHI53969.1 tRNA pseudouridine synthase B [Spiroplasma sabaudiense Ar-1343]
MLQESGVFLVDKPSGMTSNDLIKKIQKKLNIKKIGHAGTLDPLASGLMVVLVNQGTKISDFLLAENKSYIVKLQLFLDTDSKDITGAEIKREEPFKIDKKALKDIVDKYNGYIYDQYPPIYSAIKVQGKKLYEYARNKQEDLVKIEPRKVTIKECELIKYDKKEHTISLKLQVSKGTYIRSFVCDFAKDLGTIATVKELTRTASGNFKLTQAKQMDEIKWEHLLPMYETLIRSNQVLMQYHFEQDVRQGKQITLSHISSPIVFIVNDEKKVIGIYKHVANHLYACQRGLWEDDPNIKKTEAEMEGY